MQRGDLDFLLCNGKAPGPNMLEISSTVLMYDVEIC